MGTQSGASDAVPLPDRNWLPYPDFIAKLKDGRIFVIEYKGDDRYDHPKNVAKRAVGELWARKYPNGIYLMPRDKDGAGLDVDQQIAAAIAAKRSHWLIARAAPLHCAAR